MKAVISKLKCQDVYESDKCSGQCFDNCKTFAINMLHKWGRGKLKQSHEWCVGCGECAKACKAGAIIMEDKESPDER